MQRSRRRRRRSVGWLVFVWRTNIGHGLGSGEFPTAAAAACVRVKCLRVCVCVWVCALVIWVVVSGALLVQSVIIHAELFAQREIYRAEIVKQYIRLDCANFRYHMFATAQRWVRSPKTHIIGLY